MGKDKPHLQIIFQYNKSLETCLKPWFPAEEEALRPSGDPSASQEVLRGGILEHEGRGLEPAQLQLGRRLPGTPRDEELAQQVSYFTIFDWKLSLDNFSLLLFSKVPTIF